MMNYFIFGNRYCLMIAVKYGYASEANKIKMANKILSESEIQGVHLINWGYPHQVTLSVASLVPNFLSHSRILQDSITFQTKLAASEAGNIISSVLLNIAKEFYKALHCTAQG